MQSLFFKICFLAIALSVCTSCEKELFLDAVIIDTNSSLPISEAVVNVDGRDYRTNKEGKITTIALMPGREYRVKIEHPDYVSISRFYTPENVDSTGAVVFPLLKRAEKQLFNSTDSIQLSFAKDLGRIQMAPANWQVIRQDSSGEIIPYKGPVNLQLTYIDANNSQEMAAAPAPLFAESQTNRFPLQSYGMLEIYASDPEGNQLNISGDDRINITLPNLAEAQANTGLFNVNATGFWTQVGTLVLDTLTNTLQGEVSSISDAWNADDPCADELVCVSIKFVNPDGTPASIFFFYRGLTYQTAWETGSSDAQGVAELFVCPGQVFQLFNLVPCCNGQPVTDPSYQFCCVQNGISVITTIDLSGVTLTPPCTDLGVITL